MITLTAPTTAGTYQGKTAEQWRAEGRRKTQAERESWERCDTDGFMSQWAHQIGARENELKAELAENGAATTTAAVFDLDGNLVDAVWVEGDYGWSWMLLDANGRRDTTKGKRGFFSPSQARNEATERANNAKKGFYVGTVKVEAVVDIRGGSITSVNAGIFPAENSVTAANVIEIIDNGHQAAEPQEVPMPHTPAATEQHCDCDSYIGAEVTNPETGEKKFMCKSCFIAAEKIAAKGDSVDTAYGVTIAVGDTVEAANGSVGTVYGILRDRWAEANDQSWKETVVQVRWNSRTHANGVTSPVYFWDVRVDQICEASSQKLVKLNGIAIGSSEAPQPEDARLSSDGEVMLFGDDEDATGLDAPFTPTTTYVETPQPETAEQTPRYIVLDPVGRIVYTHHDDRVARRMAQVKADRNGHSMTVEARGADGARGMVERVYPAQDGVQPL